MVKHSYIFILSAFLLSACFNPKKYDEVKPQGIIQITSRDSTLNADGVSAYEVNAKIVDSKADKARSFVVFKTTLGSFIGGTDSIKVSSGDNNSFSAKLVSSKSGVATVSAIVQKIIAIEKPAITFKSVAADLISVAVDSISIKNNNKSAVVITATLKTSNGGKASAGTLINFKVVDNSGQPLGMFLNDVDYGKSDLNGQVQVKFVPVNTVYLGYLTVIAQTTANDGSLISGSTRFFLTN